MEDEHHQTVADGGGTAFVCHREERAAHVVLTIGNPDHCPFCGVEIETWPLEHEGDDDS